MTNPAILEALAKAMNGPHLPVPGDSKHTLSELRDIKWQNIGKGDRQNFLNQAAAVLELVGPKQLEWEMLSESGQFYRANAPLFGSVRVENYGGGFNVLWSVPGYCDTLVPGRFVSAELAQAAAQAHADAAHWANTPLGELVGVA